MKLTVHDVGHGLCISLIHDNGNVMLWDCGHSERNRPSQFLTSEGIREVGRFFVTNYDEDHISDLPDLRKAVRVSILVRNTSISVDQLRVLKRQSGPISPAMESMLEMMETYTSPGAQDPAFPIVEWQTFCNKYRSEFSDTNNISLVTFLDCCGSGFLIPGDIEMAGWKELLKRDEFKRALGNVHYFIASHHGRENGYCQEIFNYCKPKAFIFSDSEIKYATQEMAAIYSKHASGITFNDEKRYVLSTRKDGYIYWNI